MPLKTTIDELPTLNLTSMIDVLFLLIIFFMVGTEFTDMDRSIDLAVPELRRGGALTDAPTRRVVNVLADGRIDLDRQNVSLGELTTQLSAARQQYATLGVLVRGDGQGTFQRVAEVLGACKEAGIADVGIAVRIRSDRQRTR
jgi:biopolymer transport protein ExbD